MDWITEYVGMLGDPAHWAFELTVQVVVDGLILGLGFRLGKRWIARHDRKHHAPHVHEGCGCVGVCTCDRWPYNTEITEDHEDEPVLRPSEEELLVRLAEEMRERDHRKRDAVMKMSPEAQALWHIRNLGWDDEG